MLGDDKDVAGTQQATTLIRYSSPTRELETVEEKQSPPVNLMANVHAQRIAVLCAHFCQSYSFYCKALLDYHTNTTEPLPDLPFEGLSEGATPDKEVEKFTNTIDCTRAMMLAWEATGNKDHKLRDAFGCNLALSRARMARTAQVLNDYFEGLNPETKALAQTFAGHQLELIDSLCPTRMNGSEKAEADDDYEVYKLKI
jgi:hypothetical protein